MPITPYLLKADFLQVGKNVIVIDAGGGTIDISGYVVESKNPLEVEEIFASECTSRLISYAPVDDTSHRSPTRSHHCDEEGP